MPLIDDMRDLVRRTHARFDEWNDFFEHTKAVSRGFQAWVSDGNILRGNNAATGQSFTETDLLDFSQYYITVNLAPMMLQRYIAVFEVYVIGFLRLLLRDSPGNLGTKTIKLSDLIAKGSIASVIEDAIDEKLVQIAYSKPKDWFDYINTVEKLGCPSEDEIQRIAEMKATRDLFEHSAGVANAIYLAKAGSKARYKEGDSVEVLDPYLLECWTLLKKVSEDMVESIGKVRS